MNTLPPPQNETLFEAVKRGEKKRLPLIASLKHTSVGKDNLSAFIEVMNELGSQLAAELIVLAWTDLDVESRLRLIREWLDGKDSERQVGGYHTLSARLLVADPESSMTFLDRVVKLASSSSVCRKRALSATKTEWIGSSIDQARFRRLDLGLLTTSRVVILDWLCDSCAAETGPADTEQRRAHLIDESRKRTAIVSEWLANLQTESLSEPVASALGRCIAKLSLRA
jgi:hypothetical protein